MAVVAGNTVVRGIIDTNAVIVDERPKNFREGILRLFPTGTAALTALTAEMPMEAVDDPTFNWFSKTLPTFAGDLQGNGVFLDSAMTVAYTTGGVAGDVLFVKADEATAALIVAEENILLRDKSDLTADTVARVTDVVINGNESRLTVQLLVAEPSAGALAGADRLLQIGRAHSENSEIPKAIHRLSEKRLNNTQIFQNALSISRTARKTRFRTGDKYAEAKLDSLEDHVIGIEKAFIWGERTEIIGTNGEPRRTTQGLIPVIKEFAAAGNVADFPTDTAFTGQDWIVGGEQWFNERLEEIFRFGRRDKMAFAGSGAVLGLQRLAEAFGTTNLLPGATEFGLAVRDWVTFFGTIRIFTHPLFSFESTNRNSIVIFEPEEMVFRFVDDTFFKTDRSETEGGLGSRDGRLEAWLTEAGLEFHFPEAWGYLTGVGLDNTL